MKIFVLFFCVLLSFSCKNDSIINSSFDKIEISGSKNSRLIEYTYLETNRKINLLLNENSIMMIPNEQNKLDGKSYILSEKGVIKAVNYFVNNQLVYYFNVSQKSVNRSNIFQINEINKNLLMKPIVESNYGKDVYSCKIIGTNYPLILSELKFDNKSNFVKGSFKRNLIEDSIEFEINPIDSSFNIVMEFQDSVGNSIHKFNILRLRNKLEIM